MSRTYKSIINSVLKIFEFCRLTAEKKIFSKNISGILSQPGNRPKMALFFA